MSPGPKRAQVSARVTRKSCASQRANTARLSPPAHERRMRIRSPTPTLGHASPRHIPRLGCMYYRGTASFLPPLQSELCVWCVRHTRLGDVRACTVWCVSDSERPTDAHPHPRGKGGRDREREEPLAKIPRRILPYIPPQRSGGKYGTPRGRGGSVAVVQGPSNPETGRTVLPAGGTWTR